MELMNRVRAILDELHRGRRRSLYSASRRSCVVRKRRAACYHNRSQDDQGQSPVDQPVLRHSQSERTGFFARLQHLRVFPISARFTFLPLLRILFANDRTAMRLLVNSPLLPELRTVKNGHRWEGHRISALSCVGDRLRSGCAVG